jgi:hypothetical protein
VDDPSVIYLVLGVAALVLAAAWWSRRDRRFLIGIGVVAALFLILFLVSSLVDTDAKRIQRALTAMAEGVNARNADQIFAHISDRFRLGSRGKQEFRPIVERYLKSGEVTRMKYWDFEPHALARDTATILFKVKGEGSANFGYEFFNCRAVFVRDPDGRWRLQTFWLYAPQTDPTSEESLTLPF